MLCLICSKFRNVRHVELDLHCLQFATLGVNFLLGFALLLPPTRHLIRNSLLVCEAGFDLRLRRVHGPRKRGSPCHYSRELNGTDRKALWYRYFLDLIAKFLSDRLLASSFATLNASATCCLTAFSLAIFL